MLDAKLMDAARAYEQSIESRRDRFWGEVWTLFILVAAARVGGSIGGQYNGGYCGRRG